MYNFFVFAFFLFFFYSPLFIFLIPPLPYASFFCVYFFLPPLIHEMLPKYRTKFFRKINFFTNAPAQECFFCVYILPTSNMYNFFVFAFFSFFYRSLLIFLIPPLPYASSFFVYTSFYHHLFTKCFQNI